MLQAPDQRWSQHRRQDSGLLSLLLLFSFAEQNGVTPLMASCEGPSVDAVVFFLDETKSDAAATDNVTCLLMFNAHLMCRTEATSGTAPLRMAVWPPFR